MPRVPFPATTLATVAITAAAALLLGSVGIPAVAATPGAHGPGPGPDLRPQWSRVTLGNLVNFADIGLVRGPGGVLHVIWKDGNTGKVGIFDTPIRPDGIVERPVVISHPYEEATFPDATTNGSSLHAFWNEISNAGQRFSGTAIARWPSGGKHWDPITGVTSAENENWGDGVAAATGADGQPWVVFTDGGGFEVLHIGHIKRQINMSGCCRANTGIGVDSRTSDAWLTWFSDVTDHYGVYAQQLTENGSKVGPPIRMPGSNAGNNAILTNQRTTATGLGGNRPGVYLTYLVGWPTASKVALIRLGSNAPVTVTDQHGMTGSTLAADPFGRIWVAWYDSSVDHNALFVRLVGRPASGTSLSPQVRVPLPARATFLWKVYINAQARRLDLLALLTVRGKIAYWATQVPEPK